ncbi:MAG: hypothetical protein KC583_17750 [Myxococcales bacterium]|nr:hypothetical protein [Myxococcales bacterium]
MPVRLDIPRRARALWTQADARELAEGVAARIVARTRKGIDATGERFAPLRDGSPSTLERSGRLLRSIRGRAQGTTAVITAGVDYASHVQEGGRRGGKRQAGREFMGLSDAEKAELEDAVRDTLDERLGVDR